MTSQFSDTANTDNPEHVTITGKVLVLEYHVDAAGYVLSRSRRPNEDIRCTIRNPREGEVVGDESGAVTAPFDRAEIVWFEPGWPVDAEGRGATILEVKGKHYIEQERKLIARRAREWEEQNPAHAAVITRFAA